MPSPGSRLSRPEASTGCEPAGAKLRWLAAGGRGAGGAQRALVPDEGRNSIRGRRILSLEGPREARLAVPGATRGRSPTTDSRHISGHNLRTVGDCGSKTCRFAGDLAPLPGFEPGFPD